MSPVISPPDCYALRVFTATVFLYSVQWEVSKYRFIMIRQNNDNQTIIA